MKAINSQQSFLPPLWIITLIFLASFFWLLVELKELCVLLVVSYSIAYALNPTVSSLTKYTASRTLSIFIVFIILVLIVTLLFVTAVPTVVEQYTGLSQNLTQYLETAQQRLQPFLDKLSAKLPHDWRSTADLSKSLDTLPWLKSRLNGEFLGQIISGVTAFLMHGYNITLTIVNILLLPFFVFYILIDFKQIHRIPLNFFPITKRPKVEKTISEIDSHITAFFSGQLTVCCLLAIMYAIGLGSLGVELWFLLAVISGFGNMIPYFGLIVGIILSSLMTLVTFGDFRHLLIVWGMFAAIQFVEGTFITPKIVGNSVGLSPFVVILALVVGGQLFGLLGVFLAVPVTAALRVLGRELHSWVMNSA